MGMDVIGLAPRSEKGECFTNNNSWWRGLADYCRQIAPDVCGACEDWYTNDGDGLDDAGAVALAKILKAHIADGSVPNHARVHTSALEMLPNVPCPRCNGGKENICLSIEDIVRDESKWTHDMGCALCNNTGYCRPAAVSYEFSIENVAEFARFLEDCGGFEIW